MYQFKVFTFMATVVIFLLLLMFGLACVPLFDVPLPSLVRENHYLKKLFAWDCLENCEQYDQESLMLYLKHRDKSRIV